VFAAIFEVQPKQGKFDEYLSLAKFLRPKLEAIDGFVEIDRFANERTPRRVLSLSTWRDEKAVVRWRTQSDHQAAQEKGRFEVFEDRHLQLATSSSRIARRRPGLRSWNNASTRPKQAGRRSSP
jgi:heme-degrading monooxygenase HmoA